MAEGVDGVRIATKSGGPPGLDALFVHATGFCKEVWDPVIDWIATEPFSWLSLDLRGHGDSATGEFPHHWDLLARDVLAVLDGRTGMVGVGHSCGAATLARVESLLPGTFRRLVLIEPIIFPPPFSRIEGPMSAVAIKRRPFFESREAARERFRTGPFVDWDEDSLDAYLDGGFRHSESGWLLKCSPEVEADFYAEGSNHDTWDRVGSLKVPVMLVAAEHSETHQQPFLDALVAQFPIAELIVLDGAGHLVPMEDPQRIAGLIDVALGSS